MLTNGREEYQMTPGDGEWGNRTESDLLEGFIPARSLFIALYLCERGSGG